VSTLSHSARLAPFQPETVWTLDGAELVERRGPREVRFALSGLTLFRLARPREGGRRRILQLTFGRRRVVLTAQSYVGPGRFEDRLASFSILARAIAAVAVDLAPRARFAAAGGADPREGLSWIIGLLGLGMAVMLMFAFSPGLAGMSVAIVARMGFVLILILAVLPWLGRGDALDPLALPDDLLPPA